jgi:formate dehydrogenase subunit gamma
MFAAFLLMFLRYWRDNLIERDDLEWAKNIRKVAQNEEVGDTGRYNFGQKCVFWAAIVSLLLLLASGIVIWRPYFAGAFSIPIIRLALVVHSVSAVVLIMVIMVHIYAALWVKGTITAMVEGWVTPAWAKKHHPRWYRQIRKNKP